MPRRSYTLHRQFSSSVSSLNATRQRLELAFTSGALSIDDITQGYAGLYLDLFTEFEGLLEELFMGMLSGAIYTRNTTIVRKIKISPSSEAERVLLDTKEYLDWLPYTNKTIPRAKTYFQDGKPFTLLTNIETDKLSNYQKIRNAIAHKSKKAMREFEKIIDNLILLPHEREPRGYLRNIPNATTGKSQLELIGDELDAIAHKICN